jgi:hypothetical protein
VAENRIREALARVLEDLGGTEKRSDSSTYSSCLESLEEAARGASTDNGSVVSMVEHQVCTLLGKLLSGELPVLEKCKIEAQICNLATSLPKRQRCPDKALTGQVEELYCYATSIPLVDPPSSTKSSL